jgi:AraC family transcriptional regulator of arabinose operon
MSAKIKFLSVMKTTPTQSAAAPALDDDADCCRWGEIVYPPKARFGPRYQSYFQLVVVFDGSMWISAGRDRVELQQGQGIWLLPDTMELFEMNMEQPTHHGWIHVPKTHDIGLLTQHLDLQQRVFQLRLEFHSLLNCLRQHLAATPDQPSRFLKALNESACWWVVRELGCEPSAHPPRHPALQKALSYIHRHFHQPVDLSTLASVAAISPQQLTRLFQQALHTSPIRYLWEYRDLQSVRLLRESGCPVGEIAQRCGYPNPYHFTRRIRARFGQTPTALRKQHWAGTRGGT